MTRSHASILALARLPATRATNIDRRYIRRALPASKTAALHYFYTKPGDVLTRSPALKGLKTGRKRETTCLPVPSTKQKFKNRHAHQRTQSKSCKQGCHVPRTETPSMWPLSRVPVASHSVPAEHFPVRCGPPLSAGSRGSTRGFPCGSPSPRNAGGKGFRKGAERAPRRACVGFIAHTHA